MSSIRRCKICGKSYNYCPGCAKDYNKPKWMISFDKFDCKNLFDTLSMNGVGTLSDEKAIEALNAIDYKSLGITNQSVLNHIDRLLNGPKPVKEEAKEETKEDAKEEPKEEVVPEVKEEANAEKTEGKAESKGEPKVETKENKSKQGFFQNKKNNNNGVNSSNNVNSNAKANGNSSEMPDMFSFASDSTNIG